MLRLIVRKIKSLANHEPESVYWAVSRTHDHVYQTWHDRGHALSYHPTREEAEAALSGYRQTRESIDRFFEGIGVK